MNTFGHVQGLYYFLLGRPSPIWGLLDFYVFAPINNTKNKWNSSKFQLREKLGGGNFGVTFEGLRINVSMDVQAVHLASNPACCLHGWPAHRQELALALAGRQRSDAAAQSIC